MFTTQHIPQILSRLVHELALTMPIAFISNILFYRNGILVANCDWERPGGRPKIILDEFQPAYITFHKNFNNFTDIEVAAIDTEGKEVRIRPVLAKLRKQKLF